MSREILNDPPPRPGFFGKLPSAGDFVSRGLPPTFRTHWDGWVTRHLARRTADLPATGLRFRLTSGRRVAAGVVLSGQDRVGRRFPLSLILIGQSLPHPAGLDAWCDAALVAAAPALAGAADPDALIESLEALPLPPGPAETGTGMQLWTRHTAPVECEPTSPGSALAMVLARG